MSDVVLQRPASGAGVKKKKKVAQQRILPPQPRADHEHAAAAPIEQQREGEAAAAAAAVPVAEDIEERKEQVEADGEAAAAAASVEAAVESSVQPLSEAPCDPAPAAASSSSSSASSSALQPQQPLQIAPMLAAASAVSPSAEQQPVMQPQWQSPPSAVSQPVHPFFQPQLQQPVHPIFQPQSQMMMQQPSQLADLFVASPAVIADAPDAAAAVVADAPIEEAAPIQPAVQQQPLVAEPAPVHAAVVDDALIDHDAPIAAAYPQLVLEPAEPAVRQISADPGVGEAAAEVAEVGELSEEEELEQAGEGEGYPHSFEPGNMSAEGQQMAAASVAPASYEAREGEVHPMTPLQQQQQQHQPPLQHNPYAVAAMMQQQPQQPQWQMPPQMQPQMPLHTQQPLFQYPPVQMQQQQQPQMMQPQWQPPSSAISQPVHPMFQPQPQMMQQQPLMQPQQPMQMQASPQMALVQPQQISVPSMLNEQIALRAQAAPVHRVVASVQGPLESDARCAALLSKELSDLSSYARWFERKAGTLRGRFFDLVEQYRTAQFLVCEAQHSMLDIQAKAAVQLQTLWRLRQVRLDQRHVCGDAVTLEHSITHAVAEFDAPSAERAHDSLVELQRLAVQQLTAHRFLAQSARLQVELFLSELLAPKGLAGPSASASASRSPHHSREGEGMAAVPGGMPVHTNLEGETPAAPFSPAAASAVSSSASAMPASASSSASSSSVSSAAAPNADFIAQLRSCIDVLFFFEKLRDEAHQTARNLWRMRARQRRDQRAQIQASKFAVDAILAAQPQDQAPAPDAAMPQPLIVPQPFPASASASSPSAAAAAAAAAAAVAADDFPGDDDDGESDDIDVFEDPSCVSPASPSSPSAAAAAAPMKEEVQFRAAVRKWLKIVVEALYTCGSHADHQYVLSQVLRCRGVTKWASFLQFQRANARDVEAKAQARLQAMQPPAAVSPGDAEADGWEWSEAFVRHFLSSLTLILSPLDGKQLKLSPSAAPPASAAAIAAATASASVPKLDRMSSEEEAAAVAAGGQWHREAAAEEGEAVRVDAAASLSPVPPAAAAAGDFDDDDDFGAAVPGGHAKKPSSGFVAPAPVAPGSGDAAPAASSLSSLNASAGAEWIVLDESKLKNALNADVSYKVSLNESDYADLLAQTPILPFVRSRFFNLFLGLARRHTGMHVAQRDARSGGGDGGGYDSAYESFDRASLSTAFSEVKLVLALLSGALCKLPSQYAQLSKFIAKIQCQIVGLIGEAWVRSWRAAKDEMAQQGQGGLHMHDDAADHAAPAAAEESPNGTTSTSHTGLYPYPCCYACHGFYALLQKELDFAVLRLLCGIQHAEVGIKYFLSELPLHVISVEAAGQALLALLGQARTGDYADSSLAFSPLLLQPWFSFLSTATGVQTRASFASLLLNPRGDYIHVLMALTKLCTRQPFVISPAIIAPRGMEAKPRKTRAPQPQGPLILGTDESVMRVPEEKRADEAGDDDDASSSDDDGAPSVRCYRFQSPPTDLPLIFLHELFHVAYLNLATREEVFRPVQNFIVTLCGVHPLSISFLLFLCHCNFKYISQGAVALFESMSLEAWRPLASDMYILQSLLLTSATSPANELARVILAKLNFDSVITRAENAADLATMGNRAGKHSRRSSWQQQQAMMPQQAASAFAAAAAGPAVSGAQLFFPPRARTPVLGFAFHRALLLMLADVRLASIRGAVLPSSLASSSQNHAASPSSPPPCPFTSFIAFPTCVWGHLLPASESRRNSELMSNVPQPPPVEQHLQQQFLLQQQQQAGYASPPSNAPAFSSGSAPLPPASQSFAASSASSLSALLAPASAALADVFGSGSSKRPIDPAWWLRMLALLCPRDSFAPLTAGNVANANASPAAPPPSKSWLSSRWSVTGVDLEEYTNLVRRDPVLSYIQLQTSWVGADAKVFAREGWPMIKSLLSDPTFQPLGYRALHDLIPVLVRAPLMPTQPPSPAMGAQHAGGNPPMLALAAPSAAASASSPGMPPRIPPRPSISLGGAAPPSNPFLAAGEGQMQSAVQRMQSSAIVLAASSLPMVQQLGILRHLIDVARPRGMFSFVHGKNVTFEQTTFLGHVMAAHMLEAMRSDCATAAAAGPIAAVVSPMQSLFVYWSSEIVRATKHTTDVWQKDHNLRCLFDHLCRAVLLFSDWFSGDARAKANALLLSPSMRLLFQFTGEQAMAAAAASTGGSNSVASLGAERRSGAYLELGGDVSAQVAAADGGANALDEDVELRFGFEPNIKPARAIIESLVPPESIMTAMALTPKECLARHPFASFVALLEETLADRAAWLKLGHMICRWEASSVLKVALKRLGVVDDRVRRGCIVRRWFLHCLALGVDHPLLPLFWQMAFRLLFARMHLQRPLPNNMGGFFGYRFLTGTSGKQLMQQCREQLSLLVTLTAKKRLDAIENGRAGSTLHPSVYELPALFGAMNLWLTAGSGESSSAASASEPAAGHLNALRERIMGFGVELPEKFLPKRLASILLPAAHRNTALWWDLVDMSRLRFDVVSELANPSGTKAALDLVPTARGFHVLLPGSSAAPEIAAHRFFHRYYVQQNYALARYAPSPSQVLALLHRKKPHEITTSSPSASSSAASSTSSSNPFAGAVAPLTEIEVQSVFRVTEYLSPEVAKLFQNGGGGGDSAAQRALVASAVVASGGAAVKRRAGSMGYWSSSVSPAPPMPVLGRGDAEHDPLSRCALQIPSVLLASLWDLLAEDSSSALQPLHHATRLFTERFSRLSALHRQLIDLYPSLYRNERAEFALSQPCKVGWGGSSKCRAPVTFHFSYTRAMRLKRIDESIQANRIQALACIDEKIAPAIREEVSLGLCATLIAVQRLLQQILLVAAQPVQGEGDGALAARQGEIEGAAEGGAMLPPGGARFKPQILGSPHQPADRANADWQRYVVVAGLKWLFGLAELDSQLTMLFPPAQHFVHSTVASLAPLLSHPYAHSVGLQERLLEILGRHPALLPSLASSVRPEIAVDPHAYLQLFRLAILVRDGDSGITSVRVLRRFDVERWVSQQPPPPFATRSQLFTICVQQLREEERRKIGRSVTAPNDLLCSVYADMIGVLSRAFFPDLFTRLLRALLEDTSTFGANGSPYVPAIAAASSSSSSSSSASSLSTLPRAPGWLHSLWRSLRELPLHTLEWPSITEACALVEGCLWDVRRAHSAQVASLQAQKAQAHIPPILTHSNVRVHALLGDLLHPITLFYRAVFTAMHPSEHHVAALHGSATSAAVCYASPVAKKNAAWQCVWQCFSAFCAPDPPPLAGPTAVTNPPAHPQLDAQQQTVLSALVDCMSILQAGSRLDDGWVMQSFWHSYREQITVNADAPFLAMLHHSLIQHTRIHTSIDAAADRAPLFRPIPSPPLLDFHASWVLTTADLLSFGHTLKQSIELHEREVTAMMATETLKREADYAQQQALAKGIARREAKLNPPPAVTRQDVRSSSQMAAKVGLVSTFLSHLIAAADWSYNLQQQKPAPVQPRPEDAAGLGGLSPRHSEAMRVMPAGLYEPAPVSHPYELYDASPSGEYASTLLLTLVSILVELPYAPFNSHLPAVAYTSLLLPHVQRVLDTLMRLDWCGVFLVRLPVEAFQMRYGRKARSARENLAAPEDENIFLLANDPADDVDDGPQTVLPSAEEVHAAGLTALDREVNAMQSLLEQVSMVLYSDRCVSKITEEVTYLSAISQQQSAAASSSSPAVKTSLLSSLLTNPFAALVTSVHSGLSAAPSSSSSHPQHSPEMKREDSFSPHVPHAARSSGVNGPAPAVPLLTDADSYGLVRPAFLPSKSPGSFGVGQLVPRYINDEDSVSRGCNVATPIARVHYSFRLLARLCSPLPPVAYMMHPLSVSSKFFFLPLVLSLRKCRLYSEWLLSVFHGEEAPRPLMQETAYLSLATTILHALDEHHDLIQRVVGDEEFLPVIQEYLFCANLESRGIVVSAAVKGMTERIFSGASYQRLALGAFTASCRSIISLEKLATFLESVLQAWMVAHGVFGHSASRSGGGGGGAVSHWQTVSATLQVPELSFDDFLFACLNNGSILTLHVVALQQLMMAARLLSNPYAAGSAVAAGGGGGGGAGKEGHMDAVPSTPLSSSLLDPLTKHTLAQPRTSHAPAASVSASSSVAAAPAAAAPILDPRPIQQRIDQLAQWLQKAHVKDAPPEKKESKQEKKESLNRAASLSAAASASGSVSPRLTVIADEDLEPVKLLVVLRTLLEWQGSLARAYLTSRSFPVHLCVQQQQPAGAASAVSPSAVSVSSAAGAGGPRWSNPLLATLAIDPTDPFPLLASADVLVDGLQQQLLKWVGETRSQGGLMGAFGLANHHRFSVRFRILLRALHTYLLMHSHSTSANAAVALASGSTKQHRSPALHFAWDSSLSSSTPGTARVALLHHFLSLSSHKSFAAHVGTIRVVGAMLAQAADPEKYLPNNPNASLFVPLIYASSMLDQLVAAVFPELAH